MGVATGFSVTFVVYIRIYLTVRRHNSPIQYMQVQDNARIRSNASEASCLRTQRHAPARTWTRAVRPRFQNTDHWTTHASQSHAPILFYQVFFLLSSICIALIETLAWLSLWKKKYLSSYLNSIIYCWKLRHLTPCHGHTQEHVTARGRNEPSHLIYNRSSNVVHLDNWSLLCDWQRLCAVWAWQSKQGKTRIALHLHSVVWCDSRNNYKFNFWMKKR